MPSRYTRMIFTLYLSLFFFHSNDSRLSTDKIANFHDFTNSIYIQYRFVKRNIYNRHSKYWYDETKNIWFSNNIITI